MATPNMNLNLPVVSTTPGPQWASIINSAFSLVDSHNHTSGNGVAIPSGGLNINADLPFNSNNATLLRSVRFQPQNAPISLGNDLSCLYSVNGDLYYNTGAGAQIQLTIGGALNATSIGGIGGDYQTSSASVYYTSLTDTFTFWQSSGINAALDVGQIKIRYPGPGAFYVGLNASVGVTADYNMTLPLSLPPSQKFMTLDAAGQIAATWAVDGSTIEVGTGTTIQVRDLGITVQKLAQAVAESLVPVGTVIGYAGQVYPPRYILCDGLAVSRSVYPVLFSAIGTIYGNGDGVTTFNLPDYRWNFLRGNGNNLWVSGSGNATGNQATFINHGYNRTGLKVLRITGTLSGISPNTVYYIIVVDANTLAFSTSYSNAMNGIRTPVSGPNSLVLQQWEDPDILTRLQPSVGNFPLTGSRQESQNQFHSHTANANIRFGAGGTSAILGSDGGGVPGLTTNNPIQTSGSGGNQSNPNNVYINYIIKAF